MLDAHVGSLMTVLSCSSPSSSPSSLAEIFAPQRLKPTREEVRLGVVIRILTSGPFLFDLGANNAAAPALPKLLPLLPFPVWNLPSLISPGKGFGDFKSDRQSAPP